MTSQEALDLASKTMELSTSTLNDEKATENEKTLAILLQETSDIIMQAVEFIEVLQDDNRKTLRLLEMAKIVIEAMEANQNFVDVINDPVVVEGQGCDCSECKDSSSCASCPTPPENIML